MTTIPYVSGSSTSQAAAEAIKPCAATMREQVLAAIRSALFIGVTDEGIAKMTGMNPSTVRPRRGELHKLGLIIDSGDRRKTASGRRAVVWIARDLP